MKTSVIIAGAGPTGLMAACQLRRFGVECIVLDKKPGPTVESRALAVQARTLEIYQQMGIAGAAVEDGQMLSRANLVIEGKIRQTIPFGEMGKGLSPYPFLLIFEQYKNEHLLYEYLKSHGGEVWWNSELIEISQDSSGVTAVIKKGEEQVTLAGDYAIGADGAKSVIRHKLEFTFTGGTYENIFFVADTEVDWQLGYEQLFLCISKSTFSGMFGMKGHHRFRVIGIMPKDFSDEHKLTLEDIEQEVAGKMKLNLDFKNTSWFSVYRLHHRNVSDFRKGRIFLAGDSAHVHSPVGGQGMNTGLQDAYNLAWKLAYVIKSCASQKLLDSYSDERLPFAKRLVKTTDRAFSFLISTGSLISFLRVTIFPVLAGIALRIKFFRRFVYGAVSQIGIEYKASNLSKNYANDFSSNAPKAGERVPYTFLNTTSGSVSIYDLLREPRFHLLIFGDKSPDVNKMESDILKIINISDKNTNTEVYKTFGIKTKGAFLVRPDNYIGFRSSSISSAEIKDYFACHMYFIKK